MLNVSRLLCAWSVFFCLLLTAAGSTAEAQTTSTNPALDKQLSRIDLGVAVAGVFNKSSSGFATVNGQPHIPVSLSPGNTGGAVVTLRYIVSPFVGFEGNYGYARYTQTFTPFGSQPNGGVQQNASEYSFGYVAHTRKQYFGVNPFASAGAGTMVFRPTPGGGLALPEQARAARIEHRGIRQCFYLSVIVSQVYFPACIRFQVDMDLVAVLVGLRG